MMDLTKMTAGMLWAEKSAAQDVPAERDYYLLLVAEINRRIEAELQAVIASSAALQSIAKAEWHV